MIERRILAALLEVQDFPTLPEVMTNILQIVEDERSSAEQLTALLECDHAISVRILRFANSPFYGLRYQVNSIRRAVVVVGFEAVKHLALATSVFDAFSKRKQFALEPKDFWKHSLGAAKAAQVLCVKYGDVALKETCFTAGLLHDIGKYFLALVLKDEYCAVVRAAKESLRPLREVELERLKTTHAEVGAWLAEHWRFPHTITNVIANLYRVSVSTIPNGMETATVVLASEISRKTGFGNAGEGHPPCLDEKALSVINLTESAVDEIVAELEPFLDETEQFLNVIAGDESEDAAL
jgi:putative nucleotidyltransferase with HDIG domain